MGVSVVVRAAQARSASMCHSRGSAERTPGGVRSWPPVEGVTQEGQQEGQLVREGDGLRAGVMGSVVLCETLVQGGLTCGPVQFLRRLLFCGNGRRGFAFRLY